MLIKYGKDILLIIAGILLTFMKSISLIYVEAFTHYSRHSQFIENGVVETSDRVITFWEYSYIPIIVGVLLIASGILGILKERLYGEEHNKNIC